MLIGSRSGFMAMKRLPYDKEVAYLESTGTQWIDTGVVPDIDTSIIMECDYTYSSTVYLFGVIDGDYRTNCFSFSGNKEGSGIFMVFVNGSPSQPSQQGNWRTAKGGSPLNTLELNKSTCIINGISYPYVDLPNFPLGIIHNIFIFTRNDKGLPNASTMAKMRLKVFQIYMDGDMVRDLIPVRVGTVGYMYDKVGGGLYGNAGSGEFVLGPDVTKKKWGV